MTAAVEAIGERPRINVGFVVLISVLQQMGIVVGIIASLFVPESPRYLIANKPDKEALAVLQRIYAIFAAISIYFVVRYIRETKGRTLEQM